MLLDSGKENNKLKTSKPNFGTLILFLKPLFGILVVLVTISKNNF